jgi:dTDP-4-dehydrorhamnose 3,5-epimerase
VLHPKPVASGAVTLPGGSVFFSGKAFEDARGRSIEVFDSGKQSQGLTASFPLAQENVISTRRAGTCRGLHYQLSPGAQAKLVTVYSGKAQIFWLPLEDGGDDLQVHSTLLGPGPFSLFTPSGCAHGFLALEDNTVFSLKLSECVSPDLRGEIAFTDPALKIEFAIPPNWSSLSLRDQTAPPFVDRRRA